MFRCKILCSSHSSWSALIVIILKGDSGKCIVINYRALNKVPQMFVWPMPKVKDIFSKFNSAQYFFTFGLQAGYSHIPLNNGSIPKWPSHHLLENMNT